MKRKNKESKKEQALKKKQTERKVDGIMTSLATMLGLTWAEDLDDQTKLKSVAYEIGVLSTKLGISNERLEEYINENTFDGSPVYIEAASAIQGGASIDFDA